MSLAVVVQHRAFRWAEVVIADRVVVGSVAIVFQRTFPVTPILEFEKPDRVSKEWDVM